MCWTLHHLQLSAQRKNNQTLLTWQSNGSKDIREYQLEISADGIHFQIIYTLKAADNQTIYNFTDNHHSNGITYYRVAARESTGNKYYSNIAITKGEQGTVTLNIFPNPTHGWLNIYANKALDSVEITLKNALGQVIKRYGHISAASGAIISLDIEAMKAGIYVVQVYSNNGVMYRVFIKQ